jgi:UDP-glucose 4-epimerase
MGTKADVHYAGSKLGDVRHSLADITLARSLLGYVPRIGVKEGIRRTVESFNRAMGAAG